MLESCGTRGRAPFNAVLTHGFTMDAKGMKMSKSLGNTTSPLDLMKEHGADILRLWALSVDFTEDHRIGKEILGGVADQYRKLRNTFRYLLGALDGFGEDEKVGVEAMPELERYMLHLTAELDRKLRQAVEDFDFNSYTRLLADFANNDLSAFYFDIRKDVLYCEINALTGSQTDTRRAYRTCSTLLFHALVRWLRAGAGVHDRGSVGHAFSGRGFGAFARMAGNSRCAGGRWPLAEAARAPRPGDRDDRAAAAGQDRRVEPRSRGDGAGTAGAARGAGRAVHRLVSQQRAMH